MTRHAGPDFGRRKKKTPAAPSLPPGLYTCFKRLLDQSRCSSCMREDTNVQEMQPRFREAVGSTGRLWQRRVAGSELHCCDRSLSQSSSLLLQLPKGCSKPQEGTFGFKMGKRNVNVLQQSRISAIPRSGSCRWLQAAVSVPRHLSYRAQPEISESPHS